MGWGGYSLGIYLRLNNENLFKNNMVVSILSLIVALSLWELTTFHIQLHIMRQVMTVCFAYTLWCIIPKRAMPFLLIKSAFPIYCMHMIVLSYFQVVPSIIPGTTSCLGFMIHWWGPIAISIVLSVMLCRFFPTLNFIYGGRR